MGIDELSKLVKSGAKCASAIANKSGVISIIGILMDFSSVNWSLILPEVKDLSAEEIVELEKLLSENFNPNDKSLKLNLSQLISLGEKSHAIVQKAVSNSIESYDAVKEIIAEWKLFLGIK